MKTVEEIFDSINAAKGELYSKAEMAEVCQQMLAAPGDLAHILFKMVNLNWWDDSVAKPSDVLIKAGGNRALYIFYAVQGGWWDDSICPCKAILEAPGDRLSAIGHAIDFGWWTDVELYQNKRKINPEQLDSEFWVTNSSNDQYDHVGWKTKRRGVNAYDIDGKLVPRMFPVFVERQEVFETNRRLYKVFMYKELGDDIPIPNYQLPTSPN